jgi:cytochrome c biogenesis protein CcdA/thiol-disulfide isomerase/thioredoxin
VLVLLGIGLLAGVVTAISPCVLPVLPILLAGGASGRHPLRIVAGLVASFSTFTLFAAWILDRLGLPADFLRNAAIVLLFVLAATLLVPRLGLLVERPLAVFSRLQPQRVGNGFGLGVVLGLVFVPCAGPVLATVSVVAANDDVGLRAILLTVAYATGAALPMLAVAFGGREVSARLRRHAGSVRAVSGAVVGLVALGLVLHVDDNLARFTPGYTSFLQRKVEENHAVRTELEKVRGGGTVLAAPSTPGTLPDDGAAPAFRPDGAWINSRPLTLQELRGKVVLVDFWTYSCINCLRTLPHLKAWYAAYHSRGLVIVGVHTPEFAFEHVASNVRAAVRRLGISYPVVQDNRYRTWDAYRNQYWPAEYLIDRRGRLRHAHFGEGEYGETESLIRRLLAARGPRARPVADSTPTGVLTPESYLGFERLANYVGRTPVPDAPAAYRFPGQQPQDTLSYAGTWRVGAQAIVAGADARLRLRFQAHDVYVVLGGSGTVRATIDGRPAGTIRVDGQRLYTVRESGRYERALLELSFTPGLQAYSFTFG